MDYDFTKNEYGGTVQEEGNYRYLLNLPKEKQICLLLKICYRKLRLWL